MTEGQSLPFPGTLFKPAFTLPPSTCEPYRLATAL